MQTSKTMNLTSRKTALILAVLLCAVVISLFSANDVFAAEEDVTTWTACGTCEWGIDPNGCLWIRPTDGVSGTLADWGSSDLPWYSRRSSVKSVMVKSGVSATTCFRMFDGMTNCTTMDLSGLNTSNVTNMEYMFYNCSGLTSLDVSGWDTRNVTNMASMFNRCSRFIRLDLDNFDTSNVTNMSNMFSGCGALRSLDVSGFDTGKVTNMGLMFYNCSKLTSLDVSSFDTRKVSNMGYMFQNCSKLTSLDVSGLNTCNVTNMRNMFYNCSKLTSLDVSGFDTGNVTDMHSMFSNCSSLASLDVSGLNTCNVTNMGYMFQNCSKLTSLDVSSFDTSKVSAMYGMFQNCSSLTSLDVSGWNTSNVTSMGYMFSGCGALGSLDVSGFDTGNVTNMGYMFDNCSGLTSLDVSGFDTANVTNMDSMFNRCSWLMRLDVSGFDTGKVTNMGLMFCRCSSLTSLDVSGFDTGNVTSLGMRSMFSNCSKLTSLDVSGFDTSKVTDMDSMFHGCSKLTSLDVSGFDTGNVTDMQQMFCSCSSLTSLDVSGFDTSKVTYMGDMFSGCSSLSSVTLGEDFSFKGYNIGYTVYQAVLPTPPSTTTTGKWVLEDNEFETSAMTPAEMRDAGTVTPGTWVWQVNDTLAIVSFDANGGYTSAANVVVNNAIAEITMPSADVTTRPEYTLLCWNTKKDGTGTAYNAGETYNNVAVLGKTTVLYAQWRSDKIATVTTNHYQQNAARDGYLLAETETENVEPGTQFSPELKDYEFFRPDEQAIVNAEENGRYTVNYYYDREVYTVHYEGNGADYGFMEDTTYNRGMKTPLAHSNFQLSGHLFSGWNTESDGSGTSYSDVQPVQNLAEDNGSITLYAQYMDISDANDAMTAEGDMIVTAKGNETIIIPGLPAGTTYTIEEIQIPSGWSKDGSSGEHGSIPAGDVAKAEFTNSYAASGTATIVAHASGTNIPVKTGMFSFELKKEGSGEDVGNATNGPLDTVETDGSDGANPWYNTAPARFEDLVFTEEGEYKYVIEQVPGDDPTIIYDEHKEYVTITVTDNGNGTMSAVVTYDDDGPLFRNERVASSTGALSIKKTITNETAVSAEKEFEFVVDLTSDDGSAIVGEFPYRKFSEGHVTTAYLHSANISDAGEKQRDLVLSDFSYEQEGVYYAADDAFVTASVENATHLTVALTYANVPDMILHIWNEDNDFSEYRRFSSDNDDAQGGFLMSVDRNGTEQYFTSQISSGCFGLNADTLSAATWYFEPVAGETNQYKIGVDTQSGRKYIINTTDNNIGLDENGAKFEVSIASAGRFYIKLVGVNKWLQYSKSGKGIRFWPDKNNVANSSIALTYASSEDAIVTETIAVPGDHVNIRLEQMRPKNSAEAGYGENSNYGFYAVVTGSEPDEEGTLQSGDTILLKGGESITILDLPYNAHYNVSENPAAGWELTNSKNTIGVLSVESVTSEFVNTYSSTGSLPITATLICEGMDEIPPEKFSFELLDEEGNVIETVYAKPDGSITFTPIDYIQSQDGSDYVYTIREVVPDDADPYVGYDPHIIELNVHVGDNGEGELVPDVVSSDETMTFRNTDKTRELTVSNNVGGNMGDWNQYFDFTIKLTNEDGSPFTAELADPETDSQHLEWTKTGDGEYTFKLKHNDEMTILVPSDVSYEIIEQPTEYEMAVTIKKDGTEVENLAEAPVAAGNMADTQTGVEVAFRAAKFMPVLTGIWSVGLMAGAALLLVSGVAIISILTIRKRKVKEAVSA